MKVAIVGATGETGSSVVKGLLESTDPKYEITALTRPASLQKPGVLQLAAKGVTVVAADLEGPEEELVKLLAGIDVVISTVDAYAFMAQIPLANAAETAGVKRFIPCFFATVTPPTGILTLRDQKEVVLNHIKKIHLPYTIIDVGWWFQLTLPRLASGRIDYALIMPGNIIAGDGDVATALTDIRDIGRYVARIISDPRTVNAMVFSYTELLSQNQVFQLLEKLSGETIDRTNMSKDAIEAGIAEAESGDPSNPLTYAKIAQFQYLNSRYIRGDNTPEYARYLGYKDAKELYPDLTGNSLESYCQEVLDGTAKGVYDRKRAEAAAVSRSS
ncbi:hypothetical protein G7Z17_g1236 [Cylindrodendrum hubeiense]|uniref:NmrA-like domain-containing protein n=1 Tax=Cylindrodendrum hubeiense TaxID=595255 RepID=A0A9P5LKB4_9HYPO|nr:hypothetical protein G7Z17_g1236 [Cylindrodendrum hubeiense]